jgi:oxygen-independent coproporphyrinogen-3 oxidase
LKETELQTAYLDDEPVETIYFGGGTPSLLEVGDLEMQLAGIRRSFKVSANAEITMEVNPDDITDEKLQSWKKAGINRLSIGIQSFFDEDLVWMNRAHNSLQAISGLELAVEHFSNITIDLIYGTPLLTNEKWKQNVQRVTDMKIPHLSCYALTVEQKTPLYKMIRENKMNDIDPDKQSEQFLLLMEWLEKAGYEHYEISNFSQPGFRSRHNSSYWKDKKYLGLGPSAHSYNGISRQWNISNNTVYIDSVMKGKPAFEKEVLTPAQKLNEYIMTSLRTMEGVDLQKIEEAAREKLRTASKKFIENGLIRPENGFLILTREGKLLADGIAAGLFF